MVFWLSRISCLHATPWLTSIANSLQLLFILEHRDTCSKEKTGVCVFLSPDSFNNRIWKPTIISYYWNDCFTGNPNWLYQLCIMLHRQTTRRFPSTGKINCVSEYLSTEYSHVHVHSVCWSKSLSPSRLKDRLFWHTEIAHLFVQGFGFRSQESESSCWPFSDGGVGYKPFENTRGSQ